MRKANLRVLPAVVALCWMVLPVNALPLNAEEIAREKESRSEKKGATAPTKGIASYYAKRYHGRKTTSGQRYDHGKLTAAHNTLPLGSRVKVVNLDNDREVIVTVNDRCAKKKVPFIDLSREAARRLGFLGEGITKVSMTVLEKEPLQ